MASETWAHAIRDLHRFHGNGMAFRGWLFTIARHRAVDQARYRDRLRRRVPDVIETPLAPSAEEEVATALSTRQALDLVAALPPRQAEAVSLRVMAGLDSATAASIMKISPAALRVNLHRGLRSLAERLRTADVAEPAR